MAVRAELELLMSAEDRMSREVAKAQKTLDRFSKSAKGAAGSFKLVNNAASKVTSAFGLGAGGLGAMALKTGISFNVLEENAQLAFQTMIAGSRTAGQYVGQLIDPAQEAAILFDSIKALALKQPFKLTELVPATQRLLAFGFAARDIPGVMKDIADTVAGLGGSPELLERVSTAFGQMLTKGKVSAEEMLQLAEAGIPAYQMLAQNVGLLGPRFAKMQAAINSGQLPLNKAILMLQKLGEKGMLPAAGAIAAIRAGMQQQFGGLGERQSKATAGAFSNLIDAFDQLAAAINRQPFRDAAGILRSMSDALDDLRKGFDGLPEPLKTFLGYLGTLAEILLAGAVVQALLRFAGLLGGGGLFGSALMWVGRVGIPLLIGAIGLLGGPLALAALLVGALALAWITDFMGIRETTGQVVDWVGEKLRTGWGYVVELFRWVGATAIFWVQTSFSTVAAWFDWLVTTAGAAISAGWQGVVEWFTWLGAAAWDTVSRLAGDVVAWFTWLVERAQAIVSGGWESVAGFFTDLWVAAVNTTATLAEGVKSWWEWLVYEIQRIWEPVGNFIADVLNRARQLPVIGGLIPGVATGTSGDQVPVHFAGGGVTRGEGLAYLHPDEVITPLSKAGAAGGGGEYHFHFHGNIYPNDVEDLVVRALDSARRAGRTI